MLDVGGHNDWDDRPKESLVEEFERNKQSKEEAYEAKIRIIDDRVNNRAVKLGSLESSFENVFSLWLVSSHNKRKEKKEVLAPIFAGLSTIIPNIPSRLRGTDETAHESLSDDKNEGREEMLSALGSWKEEDTENLKEEIKKKRETGSR